MGKVGILNTSGVFLIHECSEEVIETETVLSEISWKFVAFSNAVNIWVRPKDIRVVSSILWFNLIVVDLRGAWGVGSVSDTVISTKSVNDEWNSLLSCSHKWLDAVLAWVFVKFKLIFDWLVHLYFIYDGSTNMGKGINGLVVECHLISPVGWAHVLHFELVKSLLVLFDNIILRSLTFLLQLFLSKSQPVRVLIEELLLHNVNFGWLLLNPDFIHLTNLNCAIASLLRDSDSHGALEILLALLDFPVDLDLVNGGLGLFQQVFNVADLTAAPSPLDIAVTTCLVVQLVNQEPQLFRVPRLKFVHSRFTNLIGSILHSLELFVLVELSSEMLM